MIITLLASAILAVQPICPTSDMEWVCTEMYLNYSYEIDDIFGPANNGTNDPIQVWANGTGLTVQHVRGAATNDPPWTDPWTPLSEDWWEHTIAAYKTVPAHKSLIVELRYEESAGVESWQWFSVAPPSNMEPGAFSFGPPVTRETHWDTNPTVVDAYYGY
jgi:hypothetical protein